jgi:L-threonylcarbamoyladenylate synthase
MESRTTLRLNADNPGDVERAAALLRAGGLVAFATETVYGLGANALDPAAVARIFAAKERPRWDPLIVHVLDAAAAEQIATPNAVARRLMEQLWPGPLTLLCERTGAIPDAVTAGRSRVGLRAPAHPGARALLRLAGIPIAAPSANLFGHTSPTTAAHVLADLDGRIDAVLDGGPSGIGVESTVLDTCEQPPVIYRPGAVTREQLIALGVPAEMYRATSLNSAKQGATLQPGAAAAASELGPQAFSPEPQALPSPGLDLRHYAPRATLELVDGPQALRSACTSRRDDLEVPGVLLPAGWTLDCDCPRFDWGDWERPEELAQRLFAGLRALDDLGVSRIVCPMPAAGGLGDALRDRLLKAARRVR